MGLFDSKNSSEDVTVTPSTIPDEQTAPAAPAADAAGSTDTTPAPAVAEEPVAASGTVDTSWGSDATTPPPVELTTEAVDPVDATVVEPPAAETPAEVPPVAPEVPVGPGNPDPAAPPVEPTAPESPVAPETPAEPPVEPEVPEPVAPTNGNEIDEETEYRENKLVRHADQVTGQRSDSAWNASKALGLTPNEEWSDELVAAIKSLQLELGQVVTGYLSRDQARRLELAFIVG